MVFQSIGRLLIAVAMVAVGGTGAIAATELTFNSDGSTVRDRELKAGAVKVIVNYTPIRLGEPNSPNGDNLTYQIFYNNALKLSGKDTTYNVANVTLQDLDNNGTSEIVIRTFSGGAHCCTAITIYNWQKNRFAKIETGWLDGHGGSFQDLDGDRQLEFVSVDQSFLYRFNGYAGSFPPSTIYNLRNGKLIDTTRQYPKYLRSVAWQMYQVILEHKQDGGNRNGVLAGYVAQKALLGEFQQGWDFMLAHYDRTSDQDLEIYDKGNVIGRHPNFPAALRAHLRANDYLTVSE